MEIFTRLNLKPKKVEMSEIDSIPTTLVDEFILSPVVKRAFIQSIKVINAVIDRFGLPEDIIIELAREKNSKDRRKFINKLQKQNEATRKKIEQLLAKYGNTNAKYMIEKIKLHDMQEGKCLYSLEAIPIEDLLSNPTHYEVDHIIPRSVSFDNSLNNKVLVKQSENSKKGNRTPYQYLSLNESKISYNQFKQHILNLSKAKDRISKKKRDMLLEERDINKFEVQKEFINRNLVDTRYATSELSNLLKTYFSTNDYADKVKTINGGFTNHLRKVWDFKKHRNHGYKHHAEDALVIANADFLFKTHKALRRTDRILEQPGLEVNDTIVKADTEEKYQELFETPKQVENIKQFRDFKYSHRVDKKPNRQLINDTLYSTREIEDETYVVQTLKDLYAKDNDKVKKLFTEKPEKILMYQHDPKTFEKLMTIINQYAEAKNPLAAYYEDKGEYVTKYAKKGNGPAINKIKYIDKKLGSHLDVSNKYPETQNKLVKLSLKSFRFDIYKCEQGYKMVSIGYLDVLKKDNYYYISKDKYEAEKEKKKIKESDVFIGSFYYNDLIMYERELFRVIGVNSDINNLVELNMVDITYKDFCEVNHVTGEKRIKNRQKSCFN
ncbi:CRISPR-associated endonuclease Csn1 [Staphylococcus auricularis]